MPIDENGLSLDYQWGTTKERKSFGEALDIDLDTLTAASMIALLGDVMGGRRGDSLAHPLMSGEGDRMVCPLAYRLARMSGIDPAGFLLLERLNCYVTIRVPQWRGKLGFATHVRGLEMQAPLTDGIAWCGGWPAPNGRCVASVLSIDTDVHPIPDTLKGSLAGRPLGELVEHPLLDPGLVIRAVALEDDEHEPGGVDIRFESTAPFVRLADAAAAHHG